ncbi:MAG: methyltransferase domain-containing protein [Myxococcales bacterium]|nr:methyltransferase domain-containing protein [Myxococcales bacterium]MDH5305634.1 methyltransferase domain-containing protein [Myxococcales bacterium]MDH5565135.1 methyltransferase domain-containing protein [Myxococcales bacterium]
MTAKEQRPDIERAVRERYAAAAQERSAALCCPVDYDPRLLEVIPPAVLERDYGCGDPSRHVRSGDTVLDLGSGGGKICFVASQIVGKEGRVLGVDMNDEMLALARGAAPAVAERVGYANVEFLRGRIQDLALPLDRVDAWLAAHPVRDTASLADLDETLDRLRREQPLVADASVDIVISNCVLNLVRSEHKRQLIDEIYRVLKRGGRIAIADIVSDEEVPDALRADPALWSGCISGAFHEEELLQELVRAGFYGVAIDTWVQEPFAVIDGIEFRSVTVTAHKGLEGPCYEANQAVIYRGPWREVRDDDGHTLRRGERTAVCAKTFDLLTSEPYADHVIPMAPRDEVPEEERALFDCSRSAPRHPRETKGEDYAETRAASGCCAPDSCC